MRSKRTAVMLAATVLACAACDRVSPQANEGSDAAAPAVSLEVGTRDTPHTATVDAAAPVAMSASAGALPAPAPTDAGLPDAAGRDGASATPKRAQRN